MTHRRRIAPPGATGPAIAIVALCASLTACTTSDQGLAGKAGDATTGDPEDDDGTTGGGPGDDGGTLDAASGEGTGGGTGGAGGTTAGATDCWGIDDGSVTDLGQVRDHP